VRWIGFFVVFLAVLVLSFVTQMLAYDGGGWSIFSWNNRINAILLIVVVWVYLYISVFHNQQVQLTLNDEWVLFRGDKKWLELSDYIKFSLTHHGNQDQYYTLFLLDENLWISKSLAFDDSILHIHDFVEQVAVHLELSEEVTFQWYEKVQRWLKI
jgi:hypothetical protein